MDSNKNETDIFTLINSFFLKSALLICSVVSQKDSQQFPIFDDAWFHSNDKSIYKLPDIINEWIHFNGKTVLPPLVIEVFLDLRDITNSNIVRLQDNEGNLWNVCKGNKKTEIMLERWLIELDNESASFKNYNITNHTENNTSNQLVLLLRYLYTLVQLLPVHDLAKDLDKEYESLDAIHGSNNEKKKIIPTIGARIADGSKPILSKGRIGLSKPIISTYLNIINDSNIPSHLEQKKITPVWTQYGLLRVSVSYRRECKFVIEDTESQRSNSNQAYEVSYPIKREKLSPDTSLVPGSLSPGSKGNSIQSSLSKNNSHSNQNSLNQRKSISITRQVQPFKVGSVNSVVMNNQNLSQNSSRNPSTSSFITGLQPRRGSNSSNIGFPGQSISHLNNPSNHTLNMDSTSIESGSKYMSSFGNLRRHSSINKTPDMVNNDRKIINHNKIKQTTQIASLQHSNSSNYSEDILNFVKLIDEKPEIKNKSHNQTNNSINNISNSLLKFQNLKPSNDLLSEDLSLSLSMDPQQPQPQQQAESFAPSQSSQLNTLPIISNRRRSGSSSHSPLPSFSPPVHYPSIPSKLVGDANDDSPSSGKNMREGSIDSRPNIGRHSRSSSFDTANTGQQIPSGNNILNYRFNSRKNSITEEEDDDELLANLRPKKNGVIESSNWKVSASPKSIDSISSSFGKTRVPYRQPYQQFSQPVIVATSAQANLHKPDIHSTDILEDQDRLLKKDESDNRESQRNMIRLNHDTSKRNSRSLDNNQNDDDEMVFFMSDMNISKM